MHDQRTLFPEPRARRTDPLSSHAAADRLEQSGAARSQLGKALWLVEQFPGRTSMQLSDYGLLDRFQLARRLPELERQGLVYSDRHKAEPSEIRWWKRRT